MRFLEKDDVNTINFRLYFEIYIDIILFINIFSNNT